MNKINTSATKILEQQFADMIVTGDRLRPNDVMIGWRLRGAPEFKPAPKHRLKVVNLRVGVASVHDDFFTYDATSYTEYTIRRPIEYVPGGELMRGDVLVSLRLGKNKIWRPYRGKEQSCYVVRKVTNEKVIFFGAPLRDYRWITDAFKNAEAAVIRTTVYDSEVADHQDEPHPLSQITGHVENLSSAMEKMIWTDSPTKLGPKPESIKLTSAERGAWSREVSIRVKANEAKERNQVLVDREFEEWE